MSCILYTYEATSNFSFTRRNKSKSKVTIKTNPRFQLSKLFAGMLVIPITLPQHFLEHSKKAQISFNPTLCTFDPFVCRLYQFTLIWLAQVFSLFLSASKRASSSHKKTWETLSLALQQLLGQHSPRILKGHFLPFSLSLSLSFSFSFSAQGRLSLGFF